MKKVTEKQLREVTILVRYFIKSTKNVVLYVENDKGTRYYVTLQRNGNHSCSCPSVKECYHIKVTRQVENARIESRKAARVVETPAQEVRLPEDLRGTHKVCRVVGGPLPKREDIGTKGALTTNRGFSILRIA